jgi:hypothetical protein
MVEIFLRMWCWGEEVSDSGLTLKLAGVEEVGGKEYEKNVLLEFYKNICSGAYVASPRAVERAHAGK